jgi:hypothetical protein
VTFTVQFTFPLMKAVRVPVVSVKQFLPELTTATIPVLRWLGGTVVFEICATPQENGVCFGVQFCAPELGIGVQN